MSSNSLKSHYERKYADEEQAAAIQLIETTATPTNRFEAAVNFIPKYFNGGSILEIGAGSGNVAKTLLAQQIGISDYTLGDISLPRVEGIKRNLNDDRLKVLQIDAENLDMDKSTGYDAVIMVALIEHLIDPLRAMQNIRALLKPGGLVYIDTPNIAKYTNRIKLLLGTFPSTASTNEGLTTYAGYPTDLYDEGHLHYFTYRSLSLMLVERCGFSRITKLGYTCGRKPLGTRIHHLLATARPTLFSELAIIAHG